MKDAGILKTYFKAKTTAYPQGDERFMRIEYSLTEDDAIFVFVSYVGDSNIGESNPHGNSRHIQRPHIRNAPMVKPKILTDAGVLSAPKVLYNELTGKDIFAPCNTPTNFLLKYSQTLEVYCRSIMQFV